MISIIIPTYNRRQFIERAIASVSAQSYRAFEIIVVDDASTDGTQELLEHDHRIRYERLPKNQGVGAARNKGLDLAKGDFIVFLDSDDEILPGALERSMQIPADFIMASMRTDSGELTGFERSEGPMLFDDFLCQRNRRSYIPHFTMIRRTVIGSLKFEARNIDFIFYIRAASRGSLYYIAEPLAIYHIFVDAQSLTKQRKQPNAELSAIRARAIAAFLNEFGERIKNQNATLYSYYAYGAAVGLLLGGETTKARRLARDAAQSQPRPRYRLFYLFALLPGSPSLLMFLFSLKAIVVRNVR